MITATKKIEFIRATFGKGVISRQGSNIAVVCPYCSKGTSKKKLSICLTTFMYHCWVCGEKGKNLTKILKEKYSESDLSFYLENFDISTVKTQKENKDEEIIRLPKNFQLLVDENKCKDPDFKSCRSYLKKRGIANKDIWFFKLGTCTTGRFKRRIIIPSFDEFGDLNYYTARSIDKKGFPKYLNSKNDRRDIIFNSINIDWKKEIVLCEGPFDLFKCGENAVCILGSNLNEQYYLFKKIVANRTPVVLALDPDAYRKSMKIAKLLSSYCCDVRIVNFSSHNDVGEMSKLEFKKIKEAARTVGYADRLFYKISSIESGSII